jgi:glycosyltransferase involved in cell wall biosynthesis
VVEPGDDAAIADALATLIAESASARAARAEASRARICSTFSADALARHTERLILNLSTDSATPVTMPGDH